MSTITLDEWASLAQLAKQAGIPYQTARSAALAGHFRIIPISEGQGGLWLAHKQDFAAWVETYQARKVVA